MTAAVATAQSAGPVMASTATLGIARAEVVALERQWDTLDEPTRQRMLCACTRDACPSWIEGLRVYRTVPEIFRRRGPPSVARYLQAVAIDRRRAYGPELTTGRAG